MPKSKKSSTKLFGLDKMTLILLFGAVIIGFFFGAQYMKNQKESTVTNYESELRSFTHRAPKDLSFSSFRVKYPSDISLFLGEMEITNTDYIDNSDNLFLFFKKGRSEMEIVSVAMGGGGCLYSQNPDQEGPYSRYGEYDTLRSDKGYWRRSLSLTDHTKFGEDRERYTVCSARSEDEIFSSTTPVGGISYKIYPGEENNIVIFDQIVQNIEVLEN